MAEVNVAIEKRRCPECGTLNSVETISATKTHVIGKCKNKKCGKVIQRKKL